MKKLVSMGVVTGMLSLACGPTEPQETPSEQGATARTPRAGETELSKVTARYSSQDLFRGLFFGRGPVAARLPQIWGAGMPGAPRLSGAVDNEALAKQLEQQTAAFTKSGLSAHDQAALRNITAAVAKDTLSADELTKQVAVDQAAQAKSPLSDEDVAGIMAALAKTDATFFGRFGKSIQSGDPATVSAIIAETGVKLLSSTAYFQRVASSALPQGGFAAGLGLGRGIGRTVESDIDVVEEVQVASSVELAAEAVVAVAFFLVIAIVFVHGERDFGDTSNAARHEAWMKVIAADLAV